MYIKLINNQPIRYSLEQLRQDNPQTSFPSSMSEALLAEYLVYVVQPSMAPIPSANQALEETGYEQVSDGSWVQVWNLRSMTEQELAAQAQERDERKRMEYQLEADPLFFKWQRGESTEQAWRDKVTEIKNRA